MGLKGLIGNERNGHHGYESGTAVGRERGRSLGYEDNCIHERIRFWVPFETLIERLAMPCPYRIYI